MKEILTAIAFSLSSGINIDFVFFVCQKKADVEHFDGENFFFLLHIFFMEHTKIFKNFFFFISLSMQNIFKGYRKNFLKYLFVSNVVT